MVIGGRAKLLLDNDFTILEGDDGFYALSGYTKNEFISLCKNKCKNNMQGMDHHLLLEQIEKNPDINEMEFRIYTKNHDLRWINGKYEIVGYQENIPIIEGLFCDITHFKNQQYETSVILDNIPGAIVKYLINDNLDIIEANSKFYELFGTTPTDYVNGSIARFSEAKKKQTIEIMKKNAYAQKDITLEYKTPNKKTGEDVWIHWEGKYMGMRDGYPVYLAVLIDITDRKRLENELRIAKDLYNYADDLIEMANKDPLTGIDNRGSFRSKVETFRRSKSCSDSYALLMLDIDGFKNVNDTCGHLFGDKVLCQVTAILNEHISSNMLIGRFGGDEFLIFVKHTNYDDLCALARDINTKISCIDVGKAEHISGSIGGILTTDIISNYNKLLQTADEALYEVKTSGKNNYNIKTSLSV